MTNEQIIKEIDRLGKEIRRLYEENNLKERNELVEKRIELKRKADYGYRVGDVVEYRHGRGWKKDKIVAISDTWHISFKTYNTDVHSIRTVQEKHEQTDIFEMGC